MRTSIESALLGSRWAAVREQGRAHFVRRITFWFVGGGLVFITVLSVFAHRLASSLSRPQRFPWDWYYRAGLALLGSVLLGIGLGLATWAINERLYQRVQKEG